MCEICRCEWLLSDNRVMPREHLSSEHRWRAKAKIGLHCSQISTLTVHRQKHWRLYSISSRKHTYIILTPLKPHPHFYIVKLGFTRVCIIFFISAQKHRSWVLVRTASVRRFLRVPTIYILSGNVKKNIRIFI